MTTNNIEPEKMYSIREALKFLPFAKNEPTLQKLIMDDILNNESKKFKAIALMRNKRRRYYLKGENIINLTKTYEQ